MSDLTRKKKVGRLVYWAQNTVGPARWPNSARLKEVDRLGLWFAGRLGTKGPARAHSLLGWQVMAIWAGGEAAAHLPFLPFPPPLADSPGPHVSISSLSFSPPLLLCILLCFLSDGLIRRALMTVDSGCGGDDVVLV